MHAEVVRVELVGSWWDQWAPLLAIALSLASLVFTLWTRHRDDARLEVEATTFLVGPSPLGTSTWHVAISATNVGRQGSTVVTGFLFGMPKKKGYLHLVDNAVPQLGTVPRTLGPGESITWACDLRRLAKQCIQAGLRAEDLRPRVNTGHGARAGKMKDVAASLLNGEIERQRAKS